MSKQGLKLVFDYRQQYLLLQWTRGVSETIMESYTTLRSLKNSRPILAQSCPVSTFLLIFETGGKVKCDGKLRSSNIQFPLPIYSRPLLKWGLLEHLHLSWFLIACDLCSMLGDINIHGGNHTNIWQNSKQLRMVSSLCLEEMYVLQIPSKPLELFLSLIIITKV